MLTIIISTIVFILLISLGHLLLFIHPFAYVLCPVYLLLLIITKQCFQENCKTMEKKDFLIITIFCAIAYLLFQIYEHAMSFDSFAYLYLSTFIAYICFSSSIRYKSLI